jgi:hypothetical protein
MDQQALLALAIVMTTFVVITAIAFVVQATMLYGMLKSARAVEARMATLAPKVEALMETSRAAIDEGRTGMAEIAARTKEITTRTKEILDATKRQLATIDDVLQDAAGRARVQLDRAEMVVDDAMSRAQETVAVVHGGIMKPIREINGVAAGVRAAIHYFMRGGRPNPDQVTADEEMFI